jgi:hypothetical protein
MRPDWGVAGGGAVTGEGRGATPIAQSPNLPISNLQSPVSTVKTIGTLEDADKMPRRVPQPALRPSIDLCKPTGVTIDGGSRIVVMLDQGGVGKKLVEKLQKRGATVLTLEPGIATDALDAQLKAWLAEGKIQGIFWLPALDVEQAYRRDDAGGVARTQPRARQEPLHRGAGALRQRDRAEHLPGGGDAAGRSARLRPDRRHGPVGRRGGRLHQGLQHGTDDARGRQGRHGQGGRLRAVAQDCGTGRPSHRRGALRPRRGRGRLLQGSALHRHAGRDSGQGWQSGHGARTRRPSSW